MHNPKHSQDLSVAIEAAERGGSVLRSKFRSAISVRVKAGERGVVTEADGEAETVIVNYLREHSNYSILSEEAGAIPREDTSCWVVDPLDGTSNFSRGLPLFAVSVALLKQDSVELGVIVDPLLETTYLAECGRGAFNQNNLPLPLQGQVFGNSLIFVNHGYGADDKRRAAEAVRLLSPEYSIRECGTTTLELAYTACGYADAFLCSGDELWDYAAGLRIAEEAGYVVSDWHGRPWKNENSFILVARKELWEALVHKLSPLQ